jgi:hypothetical protein
MHTVGLAGSLIDQAKLLADSMNEMTAAKAQVCGKNEVELYRQGC